MKLTNKEIAKKVGISETAVSLAKNHKKGVSDKTRKRVLQLLESNIEKKVLTGKILMSVHKNERNVIDSRPYFEELMQTIQMETLKYSETLLLAHFKEGMNEQNYLRYIQSLDCDGIIILATELEESEIEFYQQLSLPMIILDNSLDISDADVISSDGQNDFRKMMKYVYNKGYEKLGYLKSKIRTNNYEQHMFGFYAEAQRLKIDRKDLMVFEMPTSVNEAYLKMKKILNEEKIILPKPCCLLSDQDYIAIGVMQAVKEAGYRVPEEVAFVGCDDIPACEACVPSLTSFHINNMELGKIAVKRLIGKIENNDQIALRIFVPSIMVERDSICDLNNKKFFKNVSADDKIN